jgi:CDP-glycerol glycerophosphotransferase
VAVNTAQVGEEEVKYTVDGDGYVKELSKAVVGAFGEAVGINYVAPDDRPTLVEHLERCADDDYFERGIEMAISEAGLKFSAVDISPCGCVEVDFLPDLDRANQIAA